MRWAVAALILFTCGRALIATRSDGFTLDEPWHIVAGVSHLRDGDFRLNPEQPPLVKLIAALAVPDLQLPRLPRLTGKSGERRFVEKVLYLENDFDRLQRRVRVAMVLMNALLLLLLGVAIWRTFGSAVAVGALTFLAIDPSVAANMPLAMTDLPVSLAGGSAALLTVAALRDRRKADLLLAIVAFAAAIGAKHSGPLVAIALFVICVVVLVRTRKEARSRSTAIAAILLFLGAWVALWAMYGFRFLETTARDHSTNTTLELKLGDVKSGRIRGALSLANTLQLVPRAYIWGMADTVRAGLEGRGAPLLLLGKRYRDRGPFYHWPVVVFAKLPLGLTLLFVIGITAMIRFGVPPPWRLPLAALAVLNAVFLLFLIRGVGYAGVRHALPLFPAIAVLAGIGIAQMIERRSRAWMSVAAFATAAAVISAVLAPRPWEYYNEIFGGSEGAYRLFCDEGLDIGQRTKELARYTKERLEPRGIVPYVQYHLTPHEAQRRHLKIRSGRPEEADDGNDDPRMTGVFLINAKAVGRNPGLRSLWEAEPSDRIGNVLIYDGTYHLPALRASPLRRRVDRLVRADPPDYIGAEPYLLRLIRLVPGMPDPHIHLGNVAVHRGSAPDAMKFYTLGAAKTQDPVMRATLQKQIELLRRGGIRSLHPVRVPEGE